MIIDGDYLTLSSGKMLYANNGILGLGPDGVLYYGSDGQIGFMEGHLTPTEEVEIATHMVAAWTALRTKLEKREGA